MSKASGKALSLVEAARVIYHTRTPSKQQLQRVYARMKSGALPVTEFGGDPLAWKTTESALAEYLAGKMVRNRKTAVSPASADAPAPKIARPTSQTRADGRFRSMYYGMWRDYFLAVLLRRRMAHQSNRFHQAVVAGQVALLATLVTLIVTAVRFTREPILSEHVAVERWIEANTDRYQVTRWHPIRPAPDGKGTTVEVEYRYSKDTPKFISTARTFRIVGDEAEEVLSE